MSSEWGESFGASLSPLRTEGLGVLKSTNPNLLFQDICHRGKVWTPPYTLDGLPILLKSADSAYINLTYMANLSQILNMKVESEGEIAIHKIFLLPFILCPRASLNNTQAFFVMKCSNPAQ